MESVLYDAAGHRRSPATMPGYHHGRPPRNKGQRYPADPPTVEEIVAVMRAAGGGADGSRLRALIIILWRAGLRIGEALDLAETDLDRSRGAVLVRQGKGGCRREVGMDRWAWGQLQPWLDMRAELPVGALLCVIRGTTAGRHWAQSAARKQLRRTAVSAGVRRRFAPHQLRHAHAVEMAHEGVPLVVIQRQLGHANLGITSIYPPRDRQLRDHRHRALAAGARDLSNGGLGHGAVDRTSSGSLTATRSPLPRARPADDCRLPAVRPPMSALRSSAQFGSLCPVPDHEAALATTIDRDGREVVLLTRIWEQKIARDHPELFDHLDAVIEVVAQPGPTRCQPGRATTAKRSDRVAGCSWS